MNIPTLNLELTVAEIDMAFVLFQAAKQDKYSFDEIAALMKKIQDQGKPQIEALVVKRNTEEALKAAKAAPKVRKPKKVEEPVVPAADLPDLSDLKLD